MPGGLAGGDVVSAMRGRETKEQDGSVTKYSLKQHKVFLSLPPHFMSKEQNVFVRDSIKPGSINQFPPRRTKQQKI